jgi:hypothetical protein
MLKKLATLDRKYVFVIIALCIIIPLLTGIVLPVRISAPVRSAYNAMEDLPQGSYVLFSVDYDPSAKPELQPMLLALLRHAFKKNLKVIMMCLWPLGLPLGEAALDQAAKEYNKIYGEDYVNIGYRPGFSAVMLGIGREIRDIYDKDRKGIPLDSLPMMRRVHNYNDIALLIGIEAGATGDFWIRLVGAQFGQKIILGCTGVMAPDMYPYLQARQIEGLIGALKGAAEYERLVGVYGKAIRGMTAQSVAHIAIIIFIIIGNIGYFFIRKK